MCIINVDISFLSLKVKDIKEIVSKVGLTAKTDQRYLETCCPSVFKAGIVILLEMPYF